MVNLEIGQSRGEAMMEMLLGAHNISLESLQKRMVAARERLAISQQKRGLLLPAAASPPCAAPKTATTGPTSSSPSKARPLEPGHPTTVRSPADTERPTPEPHRPTLVNLFVDDVCKLPPNDLPVAVLCKMLIELSGPDAMESLKCCGHSDVVGAIQRFV